MKKKSQINVGKGLTILIAPVFLFVQLFFISAAKISLAQDVVPSQSTQKNSTAKSHLYIPGVGGSTIMMTNGKNEALLIQDYATSTRVIEESDKGRFVSQRYFPYGQTQDKENTVTDKQFTSHRNLAETGIYHTGARFYNPQLGTFIQADKVEGPNRFAYVSNNPLIFIDPKGKDKLDITITNARALANNEGIRATGIYDPDRIDRELMTDNQLFALQVGALAIAGGGLAAEAAPILLTGCLGNPVGCTTVAGIGADVALGEALPPGASTVPNIATTIRTIASADDIAGQVLGSGFFGKVLLTDANTVTKVFNPGNAKEVAYQVQMMEQYGGGIMPGIRSVLRDGHGNLIGFSMDRVHGVDLAHFAGREIPENVINDAVRQFRDLKGRGFWHGDLWARNIMVELGDDGAAQGIRLVDPYRYSTYADESFEFDEVSHLGGFLRDWNAGNATTRQGENFLDAFKTRPLNGLGRGSIPIAH